jgi:formylglycine-generating enzyme required for sulfatase activity
MPYALTFLGLARVNPATSLVVHAGVLDGSGQSPAFGIAVPNNSNLIGFAWDLQGVDWHVSSNTFTFADNELAMTVAAPPPPSLDMVPIVPGTFAMGSGAYVAQFPATSMELPVHSVTITRPFWMSKFEVKQSDYQALMGSNPSLLVGANRPVERVSWLQAVAYCDALSVQEAAAGRLPTGYEYRLPTEAEWEYCCRAGTTTDWNVGTTLDCSQANFFDGVYCVPHPTLNGQTAVVGSYAANAFGLCDMHGNVLEWCLDGWDGGPYAAGAASDPFVLNGVIRVIRGGSWDSYSINCRSAVRFGHIPTGAVHLVGFRVVCAPVL